MPSTTSDAVGRAPSKGGFFRNLFARLRSAPRSPAPVGADADDPGDGDVADAYNTDTRPAVPGSASVTHGPDGAPIVRPATDAGPSAPGYRRVVRGADGAIPIRPPIDPAPSPMAPPAPPPPSTAAEAFPCTLDADVLSGFGNPKRLGNGSMGVAHAVENDSGQKLVVKTALDAASQSDLANEAAMFRKAGEHPNIVKCHGAATLDGRDSLVLEHIDGSTGADTLLELRKRVERGELTTVQYYDVVRHLVKQMLLAEQHLKRAGVVHNDLRFENVMVEASTGTLKVIDFGIAQPNDTPARKFPVAHSSPEAMTQRRNVDARSDAYMIGQSTYLAGEGHLFQYGLPESAVPSNAQLVQGAHDYVDGKAGANAISVPSIDQQKARVRPTSPPAPAGTPPERLSRRLQQARQRIDRIAGSQSSTEANRSPLNNAPTIVEGLDPLLAKAIRCGELGQVDEGLAIVEEIHARLDANERPSGADEIETFYNDFVNRMMAADPAQRMSPEEALKHPFITGSSVEFRGDIVRRQYSDGHEDEAEARDILRQVLAPQTPAGAPDDALHAQRLRLAELEREARMLRAHRPQELAERDHLIAFAHERLERYASDGLDAALRQLATLLQSARDEQVQRDALLDRLAALNAKRDHLVALMPTMADTLDACARKIVVLAKPGGDLGQAEELLDGMERSCAAALRRAGDKKVAAVR